MSTRTSADRYPTVRLGYDPSLVESDLAAMERAHQTVIDDAAAKIAALENALALANSRHNTPDAPPEANSEANSEADELVANARREAFKLITEARKEASAVVEEARAEIGQAAPAVEATHADALRAEEQRLEARIMELQQTLAGLEEGIRSLTGMLGAQNPPAVPGHAPLSDTPPAAGHVPVEPFSIEGTTFADPVAGNGGKALVEPLLPPRRKPSPPPPPPPLEPEPAATMEHGDLSVEIDEPSDMAAPAPDGGPRASFYSRRSAQLPHIGADAGRSAISAAEELRATLSQKD